MSFYIGYTHTLINGILIPIYRRNTKLINYVGISRESTYGDERRTKNSLVLRLFEQWPQTSIDVEKQIFG